MTRTNQDLLPAVLGLITGGTILATGIYCLSATMEVTTYSQTMQPGAAGFTSGLTVALGMATVLIGFGGYILSTLSSTR